MRKIASQLAILVITSAAQAASASANEETSGKFYFGGLLGASFNNNDVGAKFIGGADAGYKFIPDLTGGLYFSYNKLGGATLGDPTINVNLDSKLVILAAEANYFAKGLLPGLYLGAKAGLAFVTASISAGGTAGTIAGALGIDTSTSRTNTEFVAGPAAGFNYTLTSTLTVGGEANWLFVTSSPGRNLFDLLATIKVWL